jgi:hypothetical protein
VPAGSREPPLPPSLVGGSTLGGVAGAFVVACTVGPLIAMGLHRAPRLAEPTCAEGLLPAVIHLGKSAPYVAIVPDGGEATRVPRIRHSDFHQDETFSGVDIAEVLREVKPGALLVNGYDLSPSGRLRGTSLFLVATQSQMPIASRYYAVCVERVMVDMTGGGEFPIDVVRSAHEVRPVGR